MPRYFLHLYDDLVVRDEEGILLEDDSAALAEAIRVARLLAAAAVAEGQLRLSDRIEIEGETGALVAAIAWRDVVRIQD
ncbi:MAG: hypothetical protein JWP15_1552 [Alphaproteobacteria bacterium]|nr:hypothetical protein [Alphaproteobacteria bacterium]